MRSPWWATACDVNKAGVSNEPNHTMKVVFPEVHASEWSWAGWNFDVELNNNGTYDAFQVETLSN